MSFELPLVFRSNAFNGAGAASGAVAPNTAGWGLGHPPPARVKDLGLVEPEIDWHKWEDSRVGWGVVAAAPKGLSDANLAANVDLRQSVRDLLKQRNDAPVFRFRKGWDHELDQFTNYAAGADVEIAGSDFEKLPKYLLILGGPKEVPWSLQFQLASNRFVGRLPLDGPDLDNYIAHLKDGWSSSGIQVRKPVVWATDFGYPDITELMRAVVAKPVYDLYAKNPKIAATFLEAASASRKKLADCLAAQRPGIVVTTSHGMTGADVQQLGALVDQNHQVLDPLSLLDEWAPDGAVWYAHACCSAGTQGGATLEKLVTAESDLGKTLKILSGIGPAVAPLPVQLLSAKKPARAFFGHVEPTVDWTLRNEETGQLFTTPIARTLYNELLQPNSVGYAMQTLLASLPAINSRYIKILENYSAKADEKARALNYALRGRDLEALVLLGDPTAVLPDDEGVS